MSIDDEANDFLMGGGGPKSAFNKYDRPGTVKGGTILEARTTQQRDMKDNEPKFWKDGNPMKQLEITVQTDERSPEIEDDDGKRRLFVKSNMTKAVRAAVQAAGAKNLAIGGKLFVQYTGDGEIPGPGLSAPKLYAAHYTPPPVGFGTDESDVAPTAGLVMSAPPVTTSVAASMPTSVQTSIPTNATTTTVAELPASWANAVPSADDPVATARAAMVAAGLVAPTAGAPGAPPPGGPHAAEHAAVLAMQAAGAALPAAHVAATPPAAVPVPSTPPAPAAGVAGPQVPPDLAAALAALTPEQRAAMGIPS